MPQLDKVTFLTQLFWLIIIFVSLYVTTVKWILPTVATILKARKKQLSLFEQQVSSLDVETQNVLSEHDISITNSISETNKILNNVNNISSTWYNQSIDKTDKEVLNSISQNYLNYIYNLHLTYLSWQDKLISSSK